MVLGELIISSIMIIISIGLYFISSNFKIVGHSTGIFDAAFWPKFLLGLLFILLCIQILKNITKIKNEGKLSNISIKFSKKTLILSLLIIAVYIISIDVLGFILSTFLFQVIFLKILHEKKISIIIFVPTIITIICYILFIKVLFIPLPRGVGIFRMFSLLFY